MFAFVSRNPGLREDEIRAKLGGDPVLVSATLGALCAQGRLRVSVRGRTYSVVGR
jgi:hypothetical protein